MGPVVFDFPTWIGIFPEFTPLNPTLGNAYFIRATGGIVDNSPTSRLLQDGNLSYLVYLATSHIAWLNCPKDASGNPSASGAPASPLVGHIGQAAEGSVNVTIDWPLDASSDSMEKYLAQSKYGVEYWAATAQYRTAQYAAQPMIVFGGRFRSPWPGANPWGRPF
jgi:hypothetical protein